MNIIEKTYSLNGSLTKRTKTDTIVLHHRAGDGDVEGVDRIHKNNDWTCIGYHFYVRKDGSIYRGRQEDTVGAHAYGYNNTSIGICAEGNFENETMSEAQKQSLKELVAYIKEKYGISKVVKHNDLGNTACPGKNYPFDEIANTTKTEENHTKVDNSYVVKDGDTLSGIANKYGTTVKKLVELNKDKYPKIAETNGNFIQTGWVLNLGQGSGNSTITYKVSADSGLWLLDVNGKKIKAYAKGKEVEYIGTGYTKYGYNYIKVKVVDDGNIGYMAKTYLK